MNKMSMSLKVLISIFCMIIFVFLYLFGGGLFSEQTDSISASQELDSNKDAFVFDPIELTYDGSGRLDFLNGVSLDGYTSKELENMVFIRISTGKNLAQKIVEYTADTDTGRVRSIRPLYLINYKGPEIQLPEKMPSMTMESIENITESLMKDSAYKVADGFGNDVRNHVRVEMGKCAYNSSIIPCTFILENEFGDRAVAKADITIEDAPAVIALKSTIIYLHLGDVFDPKSYIECAVDSEGQTILNEVICGGEINTSVLGEYEIIYELRGQIAVLKVVVAK